MRWTRPLPSVASLGNFSVVMGRSETRNDLHIANGQGSFQLKSSTLFAGATLFFFFFFIMPRIKRTKARDKCT